MTTVVEVQTTEPHRVSDARERTTLRSLPHVAPSDCKPGAGRGTGCRVFTGAERATNGGSMNKSTPRQPRRIWRARLKLDGGRTLKDRSRSAFTASATHLRWRSLQGGRGSPVPRTDRLSTISWRRRRRAPDDVRPRDESLAIRVRACAGSSDGVGCRVDAAREGQRGVRMAGTFRGVFPALGLLLTLVLQGRRGGDRRIAAAPSASAMAGCSGRSRCA